jgi:hypothetical protein
MMYVVAALVVACILLALLLLDEKARRQYLMNQAVNRGYARWVRNRDGDIQFKWGSPWVN